MTMFNPVWPRKVQKTQKLKPELDGFRVTLKFPAPDDYTKWSRVRAKNQKFLTPYEPEWPEDCLTKTFFARRLERQQRQWNTGSGAFFLIHHKTDRDIIGGINLNDIRLGAARHATLGYWLDEDYQGQGYMAESARLVIDYAFNVLKLRRLNAASLPQNDRSKHLLEKLGFEEEGYAKAYLQINGQWQDHILFGLKGNIGV